MAIEIYGYAGCTTVKKARQWAEEKGLAPGYAHFSGLPDLKEKLAEWVAMAGMEAVLNERSQTFRKLDPAIQAAITKDDDARIAAMAADPRLIKRPVGVGRNAVLTGFDKKEWEAAFLRAE